MKVFFVVVALAVICSASQDANMQKRGINLHPEMELLKGILIGGSKEVSPHLEGCVLDGAVEFHYFEDGAILLKKGLKNHSRRTVLNGLTSIGDGLTGLQKSVMECAAAGEEIVEFVSHVATVFTSPHEAFEIVMRDILYIIHHFHDVSREIRLIGSSLSAHEYETAGKIIGKMVEDGIKAPVPEAPVENVVDDSLKFIEGFFFGEAEAMGAVECFKDGSELSSDTITAYNLLRDGFEHRNIEDLFLGLKSLGKVFKLVVPTLRECHTAEHNVISFVEALVKDFSTPVGVFRIILKDAIMIFHHHQDVTHLIKESVQFFHEGAMFQSGTALGELSVMLVDPHHR